MLRGLILVGSLALVVLIAAIGYLTLEACAIRAPFQLPWLTLCADPAQTEAEDVLAALTDENQALQREIFLLERNLGGMQCEAEFDVAQLAPPVVATGPVEDAPIDAEAWETGDVGLLDGCWELDSDLRVENVSTGALTHFTQWNMCFDASGSGRERMAATDGTACEGAVSGAFDGSGALSIREPGNLSCSNDSYIYQRDLQCSLGVDGRAICNVQQPELGRHSTVRLRRSARGEL
ncbi:hypothetical protein ASD80_14435 [Devosia sp. Root635]|nr:hypothetical protein ASD80_14435 [Devosia sp. Root635]